GFAAKLAMYDDAGARLGGDELRADECFNLVQNAGLLVYTWLMPLVGPQPAPGPTSPRAEPARGPEPAPDPARLPPAPAPPPPAPRKPTTRGGAPSWALPMMIGAYAAAGTFLALGVAWTVDAQNKENAARALASQLNPTGNTTACSPAQRTVSVADCARI